MSKAANFENGRIARFLRLQDGDDECDEDEDEDEDEDDEGEDVEDLEQEVQLEDCAKSDNVPDCHVATADGYSNPAPNSGPHQSMFRPKEESNGDERLAKKIKETLASNSIDPIVGCATLTDCLRALHEEMTKNGFDQGALLTQVRSEFGQAAATALVNVIDAESAKVLRLQQNEDCSITRAMVNIFAQRGITVDRGRRLVSTFFVELDKQRHGSDGNTDCTLWMTYLCVSDEAAFHLAGLSIDDHREMAFTTLEYLDYRLKRFRTTVERWVMEMEWDKIEMELGRGDR